ncbi:hypothetical protein VSH64_34730 [Amycolatopsis rhabdoformis]|uniref:Uncharacterized protein n=1 Tax=Amycolatopsis rhabdoformis TaxID=1448059 RepID=A0ABZ1I0R0_9PSEU|nr:hypothetical protein [Amycolatopsis rhabdoformis]WSE27973.1 hypothetical protein VSH64_34730 [Amycolatopsis rhabdoformis]
MGFDRDDVVLAELDMPSTAAANEQLDDLLRPDGERVEPSAEYEARDATGSVRITVDAQRRLSGVDIRHDWSSRIPPEGLADGLFDTYVKAIQRAMVVELANSGDAPRRHDAIDGMADDIDRKPYHEWLAGIRARISAIDTQLDDIRRAEAIQAAPQNSVLRSPLGYFTLHLRNGGPAGMTGSADLLAKVGSGVDRLRQDFCEMFTAAGLAAPNSSTVRPARPAGPRAHHEDDEDSFEFRFDV